MALIKHDIADELARHAIVLDFGDLNRQAERIIAEAHARAREILQDARQQAQSLIDSAEETGHAKGYERGLAEGLEQGRIRGRDEAFAEHARALEVVAEGWKNALYHWDLSRNEMLLEAREDVLHLAAAVAAKVVRRMVQLEPSIVETQLEEALKLLSAPSMLSVVVHPDDRGLIERALPSVMHQMARSEQVTVAEDPAVQRGGCIVRTSAGAIDATIEKQLERIVDMLIPGDDGDVSSALTRIAPERSAGAASGAEPETAADHGGSEDTDTATGKIEET